MKQRMREMDYIRAISALSIIMIHVSGVYAPISRGAFAINQLVRFAVPVFILISGLLLSLSGYRIQNFAGYLQFLSKRLRKIFIPYLLWTIIYVLFKMRQDPSPIWTSPDSFLAGLGKILLFGSGHVHLYFIIIILQLYLLFPLLQYLMKSHKKAILTSCFVLTLIFQTGVYLQSMKLFVLPAPVFPNYMFFPTWIFYFVFGISFAENLESYAEKILRKTGLLIVMWVASFVLLMADSRITGTFDLSIRPSVMLYSMATFFLIYSLALRFKESRLWFMNVLEWVSCQSFTIYLSHLLILKIIALMTKSPSGTGIWAGMKGMFLLYMCGTAFTCLFAYLVGLTPAAALLGGISRKKKALKGNDASVHKIRSV